MHPTLTFELVRADHQARLEASLLHSERLLAARESRRVAETRGRPPERRSRHLLRRPAAAR
ncbi:MULTISPECIES: hypothetical protein [unclassified Cellulomonas]|uniref:hypothetical protein n=1 Tax=unclassified Cellulomonas TaxID=2620175 RepID=UPI00199A6C75|nr:hypothetical protein [Cellulomonas sp. ES6]MBD3779201.1 hypothetical protein [Micrococcales bacterium]WHP18352.1 hypothetical protein P9841_04080 [Cellulomonas sp. ES6]